MADDPAIDLAETIRRMARETETAFAIVLASRTEDWLQFSIQAMMRRLSKTKADRLFCGYGPLSTFSAKIEIGYALKIFDDDILLDLKSIQGIRNKFAHAKEPRHFDDPDLEPLFQKLSGWSKDAKRQDLFSERIKACVEVFKKHLERYALAQALEEHIAARESSPEKSP